MGFVWTTRFLPFFITQFLGAFNDNLFKNALVILLTYYGLSYGLSSSEMGTNLVPLAGGLFILPFFLFSATAGQLADKYDKATLTRYIKLSEIIIGLVVILGFVLNAIVILLVALFLLGVHSTFFGPIKYAILPGHVGLQNLPMANAWVEAGTFLAILLGAIMGGILAPKVYGPILIAGLFMISCTTGYISSRRIPDAPPPSPCLRLEPNIIKETYRILGYSLQQPSLMICILGTSWFWLMGASFLSIFPPYTRDVLHAGANIVTLFLVLFSIGIGIGSFLSTLFPKGTFQALLVPIGMMAFSILTFDLAFTTHTLEVHQQFAGMANAGEAPIQSLRVFLSNPRHIWLCVDLLLIAVTAGLYIVPLYVFIQEGSEEKFRSRIIAANNIVNAFFMVVASVLIMVLFALKISMTVLFILFATGNTLVALYTLKFVPRLRLRYKG